MRTRSGTVTSASNKRRWSAAFAAMLAGLSPLSILAISGATAVVAMQAAPAYATPTTEATLVAIRIHADWCGRCKALDPKLAAAQASTADLPIEHLRLDYTRKDDAALTAALKARGLHEPVLLAMGGKYVTGQLILVDLTSKQLLRTLPSDASEQDIRTALQEAAQEVMTP